MREKFTSSLATTRGGGLEVTRIWAGRIREAAEMGESGRGESNLGDGGAISGDGGA